MILIISAVHIISVFITFNSHIDNMKIINHLTSIKLSTNELIHANRNQASDFLPIADKINQQINSDNIFKSTWYNTQQINQANQDIPLQWSRFYSNIETYQPSDIETSLSLLSVSLDKVIQEYNILTTKKCT
ncbi:hypothetical protein ACLKMH_17105 [Psychromonas sp. KJ10-10]|uniref:hypothetical protein n=1 Tax=Psychromonas sp. KJ10-10 TaxID=3391823 RepID=UPI0039B5FBC0